MNNKKYIIVGAFVLVSLLAIGSKYYNKKIQYSGPIAALPTIVVSHVRQPVITNISEDQIISSPLTITGNAPGDWFFEASFPINLLDSKGNEIAHAVAQAHGDWRTSNTVQFKAILTFSPPSEQDSGSIIFTKDDFSDLPKNNVSVSIPIKFEVATSLVPSGVCQPGGACTAPSKPAEKNVLCVAEAADGSCIN